MLNARINKIVRLILIILIIILQYYFNKEELISSIFKNFI